MAKQLAKSREEYKKRKLEERKKAEAEREKAAAPSTRLPLWLRFAIFIALILVFFTAGALVGYSGLGNGRAMEVFQPSTWTHIYDLVEKK